MGFIGDLFKGRQQRRQERAAATGTAAQAELLRQRAGLIGQISGQIPGLLEPFGGAEGAATFQQDILPSIQTALGAAGFSPRSGAFAEAATRAGRQFFQQDLRRRQQLLSSIIGGVPGGGFAAPGGGGGAGGFLGGLGGLLGGGASLITALCWIAYAVYGNPVQAELFRAWITQHRWLTRVYRLVGPTAAHLIRRSAYIKTGTRYFLDKAIRQVLRGV